ncbi:dolichyl-phosphate-mannose--protein mannosyltransferase [Persephonella atlantica]|uniref:Dolichyl-phosphate-mannose--protein mannosyltransferase n=1 Tax=Persephonella atlantica TaxID=2699429 RepID=A0ABS1GGS6_9AQUI|nr:glycosyltransferase family 39 protein [Persephonella atlantica]MBK3332090.1 dolichyl-phosphate-mannose--protein mannosyltransferase [Persephonella atlantica]
MKKGLKIKVLIFLGLVSLLINLNVYEFRGEESLRVIVAYEMVTSNNYLQPTFLGDLYFNKPPFFNWLIAGVSFFIPWSEYTGRVVSVFFVFLTVLLIIHFSYKLFGNRILSLLAGLVYLVSVDILFWYGYLAEIDVTLTFFLFLSFYLLYVGFFENKRMFIIFSGLFTGISFLIKGFPAFVFFGLTYISFVIFSKRWKEFFNPAVYIAAVLAVVIPLLWIVNTPYPDIYIKRLFIESISRTRGGTDILKFLSHLVYYPVLNFKQFLPGSAFLLIAFLLYRKENTVLNIPFGIRIFVLATIVNYMPYILAVESRGRYIIPLFPILSIITAYLISSVEKKNLVRYFMYTSIFLITARFLLGFIGFPILMEKKASRKRVAYSIADTIDIQKKIACDCKSEKTICLYLDFIKGAPLKTSRHIPDWNYLIDCSQKKKGEVLSIYDLKGKKIYLYKRK